MPRTIIAIGGGELGELETEAIDREIVRSAGLARPRALFVPTASNDAEPYWETFQRIYGDHLGCETSVLRLIGERPSFARMANAVDAADVIYVGGGNTLRMMRRWRHLGFDRLLRKAHTRGTVMAGLSAGALCWFAWGHSDSMSFYRPDQWDYIRVRGLGLIPMTACPHYDGERRDEHFHRLIGRTGGVGIALDNGCAFQVIDDTFRILSSLPGAAAYRVTRHRGRIEQLEIPQSDSWTPLAFLTRSPQSSVFARGPLVRSTQS